MRDKVADTGTSRAIALSRRDGGSAAISKVICLDDIESGPEPQNLRFLRRLVTFLTITMIAGVLTVITLLVIRLQSDPLPALPEAIILPDGTQPTAFTRGSDWVAITTKDAILIYELDGTLRQTVDLK